MRLFIRSFFILLALSAPSRLTCADAKSQVDIMLKGMGSSLEMFDPNTLLNAPIDAAELTKFWNSLNAIATATPPADADELYNLQVVVWNIIVAGTGFTGDNPVRFTPDSNPELYKAMYQACTAFTDAKCTLLDGPVSNPGSSQEQLKGFIDSLGLPTSITSPSAAGSGSNSGTGSGSNTSNNTSSGSVTSTVETTAGSAGGATAGVAGGSTGTPVPAQGSAPAPASVPSPAPTPGTSGKKAAATPAKATKKTKVKLLVKKPGKGSRVKKAKLETPTRKK